jgi:hypothetical protein
VIGGGDPGYLRFADSFGLELETPFPYVAEGLRGGIEVLLLRD